MSEWEFSFCTTAASCVSAARFSDRITVRLGVLVCFPGLNLLNDD